MEKTKVKIDITKVPNKIHFEIQRNNRVLIQKPKKGKGSYNRKKGKQHEKDTLYY